MKSQNDFALTYVSYGRLRKRQGMRAEAQGYLVHALEFFEQLGTLIEPARVRAELVDLPRAARGGM